MKNKIKSFIDGFASYTQSPVRIRFNQEDLVKLGYYQHLCELPENKAFNFGYSIRKSLILKNDIVDFIFQYHPDSKISESALKNIILYGYLHNKEIKIKNRIFFNLSDIREMLEQNVVTLDISDYISAFYFSIQMYKKIQSSEKVRYGTFYDSVARRSGTVINYLERHMIGKLGEVAVVKILNSALSDLNIPYEVEMSYLTGNPEAADIVNIKNSKGLIIQTNKKVQIKSSVGLKSCILKESESKLVSNDFFVDYCAFSQVLVDPFAFFIDLMITFGSSFSNVVGEDLEREVDSFFKNTLVKQDFLKIPVKVAGFVSVKDMKLARQEQTIPPLTGPLTTNSFYAHVKDLQSDFSILAKEIVPQKRNG